MPPLPHHALAFGDEGHCLLKTAQFDQKGPIGNGGNGISVSNEHSVRSPFVGFIVKTHGSKSVQNRP